MDVRQIAIGAWQRALWGVLAQENDIRYRIVDVVRTARVLTYSLALQNTADLHKLTRARTEEALALALGVESVRVARTFGTVALEVQLPRPYHRILNVRALNRKDKLWFTIGQTAQGGMVHVNAGGSRYAHALVAATTGGGKTWLMRLLLWELAMQNQPADVQVLVVDGKGGGDYTDFLHLPHLVNPVVTEPRAAVGALAWALAEADRRKESGQQWPALFVFIDEVREVLAQAGGANGAAAEALKSLTQIGRGLGIHVLMATQHPTADVLGGSLAKANLPLRLVGRVMDAKASTLATGQREMGAHRLYGEGDFLAVDGATAHRLQVAALDNRSVGSMPRNGQAAHAIDLTLDLERVLDVADIDDGEELVPAQMAAWALWDWIERGLDTPSATAIRKKFNVGTPRAMEIRDYTAAMFEEFKRLGGGLLATPYSQRAKIGV